LLGGGEPSIGIFFSIFLHNEAYDKQAVESMAYGLERKLETEKKAIAYCVRLSCLGCLPRSRHVEISKHGDNIPENRSKNNKNKSSQFQNRVANPA